MALFIFVSAGEGAGFMAFFIPGVFHTREGVSRTFFVDIKFFRGTVIQEGWESHDLFFSTKR